MWMLDKLATRYRVRPSELLDIEHPYDAYCLDEAVMTFCAGVEQKLEEVPTPKGKRGSERRQRNQQRMLNRVLGIQEQDVKKFRDPADMMKGR